MNTHWLNAILIVCAFSCPVTQADEHVPDEYHPVSSGSFYYRKLGDDIAKSARESSQFSSAKWKNNLNYDREKCVQDLLARKLVDRLTKAEVIKLLGKPDWDKKAYLYEIRPDNADFKTLFINFKNGKVSSSELRLNP